VERSDWKGHVTATKGGRVRHVPMTIRLVTALREHRHLRAARVLCQGDGSPLTQKIVQNHVSRSARRAQLGKGGCIVCRTRSVRTWRCEGRQRGQFKSSPDTWISPRPNGICISVPRRSKAPFGCLTRPNPCTGLETSLTTSALSRHTLTVQAAGAGSH